MKTQSLTTSLILAGIIALPVPVALAAVLGEVASVSAIGEPLRVEIRAQGGRVDRLGDCIRLRVPPDAGDGITVVRSGRISAAGRGEQTRIVVTQSAPMFEPVVRLSIEETCDSRLQREYTLLLPYPGEVSTPLAAAAAPATTPPPAARPAQSRPAARTPRSGRTWTTTPGESVESLARALYPQDAQLRRKFAAALLRNNPHVLPEAAAAAAPLPPGTELAIPDLDRLAATAQRRAGRPATAVGSTALPTKPAKSAAEAADRLVLGEENASGAAPARGATDDTRVREERLVAAIDRSINTQLELLERIRRLEEIQAALTAQLDDLNRQAAPPAENVRPSVAADIPARPPATEPQSASSGWRYIALFAALAATLAFVLPRLRTRRSDPEPTLAVPTEEGSRRNVPAWPRSGAYDEPQHTGPATQGLGGALPEPTLSSLDWDLAPGAKPPGQLAPIVQEDETAEEHESAIELAEIMMGFGRVHGAAETLAEFIHSNPKQAVTPWLKLLEVYRAAGLRPEFDGLARQLNKTFNVKAVTWETFDEARSTACTIEQMPHVVDTVQKLWGTRDCQAYLQKLLRDNRDGTRQGFPLAVIDEILLLSSILEQELGTYRPPDVQGGGSGHGSGMHPASANTA